MKNLIIDIGSSNIKYKLKDDTTINSVPFALPVIDNYPYYEINPIEIYNIIKNIIDNINPDNVYFSTQMHGYVLLKDGKEVSNYISWRDKRGINKTPKFSINSNYGVNIKPNLPRLSIQDNQIDYDTFMTLGSYIVYKLTGNNVTSLTDVAPTGFYNVVKRKYDETSFNLPTVIDNLKVAGKYKDTNIIAPMGDHQLSILGASYDLKFKGLILNLGTAGQICMASDTYLEGDFETRPYFDNKYLLTITNIPGGAYIKAHDDIYLEDYLVKIYKESIEKLPKCDKILVTGGLLNIKKDLIIKVLERIGIDYIFNESVDAIHGIEILLDNRKDLTMKKVGLMISEIPFSNMPVLLKASGLDFFILDYEHGSFDYSAMFNIITNAKLSGIECIVRIPSNQRKDIIKILDMGASGLLLPMTNNLNDIKQVVNYGKYPPVGKRGISTMRAHSLYNPTNILDYTKNANETVKIFAQIETVEGVNNIDEIINCDGVNGVMIGPNDLSADYGCLGNSNATQILEAINKIGKYQDKDIGIITNNKNYLDLAKKNNFNYYSIGSELNAISQYCKKIVNENKD